MEILMKSSNNKEREPLLAISFHQKILVPWLYFIQPICWVKDSHRNSQTTQAVAIAIGCSAQTDSKVPLVKRSPTQLNEHEEVEILPI